MPENFKWARNKRFMRSSLHLVEKVEKKQAEKGGKTQNDYATDFKTAGRMASDWAEIGRPVFSFDRSAFEYSQLTLNNDPAPELPFDVIGIELPYEIVFDIISDPETLKDHLTGENAACDSEGRILLDHFLLAKGAFKDWVVLDRFSSPLVMKPGFLESSITDRLIHYLHVHREKTKKGIRLGKAGTRLKKNKTPRKTAHRVVGDTD